MATTPTSIRVRAYDVGFGDCFLLSFNYKTSSKHVLIDFGSFPAPKRKTAGNLPKIAAHIKKTCGGKLTAVVATHRHADHITGFATTVGGNGSGDIIRSCKPEVVIQPWTEDPDLAEDATGPKGFLSSNPRVRHVAMLFDMQRFHRSLLNFLQSAPASWRTVRRELTFLGENNLSNSSAVKNLMKMAVKPGGQKYVHFGSPTGLGTLLPGVTVSVLGPPTIDESSGVQKERKHDDAEFWHILAATGGAHTALTSSAFTRRFRARGGIPAYARWLVTQADALTRQQLLSIVRRMDDAMNNTSVILLFEVGKKTLLFPGDAQIENWSFALSKKDVTAKLKDVDFYKVGHHGSLNATPKQSLWDKFAKKGSPTSGLVTMLSTEAGHHGKTLNKTEVPRTTLVDALQHQSQLFSTQTSPLTTEEGASFVECVINA